MDGLAHGIDLVPISRIERMLDQHGDRFRNRVFTPGEQHDADHHQRGRAERYAARFAAKEAVLKALGTGLSRGITWLDVEVVRSAAGVPRVRLSGGAADRARARGLEQWHLSLSHAGGMAVASVVAMAAIADRSAGRDHVATQ